MNSLRTRVNQLRRAGREAYSLVETLIALIILSTAIFAIAGVPIMATKLALQSNSREKAVFIATMELEELEADSSTTVSRPRRAALNYPDYFVQSTKDSGMAEVVVDWAGTSGKSTLTLVRDMSAFSHNTRGEGL
ncbi:MAG: hypothetical protein WCY56_08405 [Aminobacteriaceae bacterium]